MDAIEELAQLADSMRQAAAVLADEDVDESSSSSSSRRPSTFTNVVAFGSVGAGKSAVLNSLIGHPILAVVLCQVEKAKEDMLNQLYSSISAQSSAKIEELLREEQNLSRKREHIQKQNSLLSKLTKQLGILDSRTATSSSYDSSDGPASSPANSAASSGDDWRSAFDAAANTPAGSLRFGSGSHSRRYSDPAQNEGSSGSSAGGRRISSRLSPAPPA